MEYVNRQKLVTRDVGALKKKIINDFINLINHLNRGKYLDYQFILEEISLVELYNNIKEIDYLIQYYLNTHD